MKCWPRLCPLHERLQKGFVAVLKGSSSFLISNDHIEEFTGELFVDKSTLWTSRLAVRISLYVRFCNARRKNSRPSKDSVGFDNFKLTVSGNTLHRLTFTTISLNTSATLRLKVRNIELRKWNMLE